MNALRLAALALMLPACPIVAQPSNVAGGQSGYDASLEAIEPTDEPVTVGLAGADPADIGRYLLAENAGVRGAQLSSDGRSLAFTWSVSGEPQLWVMSIEGGNSRRLTYGNGITFFHWAPSGRELIYGADDDGNEQPAFFTVAADGRSESMTLPPVAGGFRRFGDFFPDGSAIAYASTERNGLDFDLYVADLPSGAARLVREGRFAFAAHEVSPDGRRVIVSERVGEDSDNLYLLDLDTRELEVLSSPERRANHAGGGFAWLADGSGFFLASNVARERTALQLYRLGRGFELVHAADHDVENVTLCGRDDRYLAWTLNDGGYSRLLVQDRSRGVLLDVPALPEGVMSLDCAGEPARLAITIDGWRTPGSVLVLELASGKLHETFAASLAGLDPDRLVKPESIVMRARDGVELQGLLYLPDAASRGAQTRPPVVFLVHGGPTAQARPGFKPIAQYHVDRGVAVFEPNVRGSTGFGHTYVTLDDRENRLDSVRDLVDMLAHLERDGRVDVERAAVVGGSYGGYMVNAVLANFPGHFAAGVSMYGIGDWVAALEVASPDLNELMVRALRGNGIDAPFIRLLDEGHGWRKLANRLFYFRQQAEFLEQQLGRDARSDRD